MPRFAETECAVCGQTPREVKLSPPGDPFPAMEGHLDYAMQAIDQQFGESMGEKLLPSNKTIVMNKVSSLDAMYEIVVDGYVVGRMRFDIPKLGYTFLLTLEGARRIGTQSKAKWVSCYDGVLDYMKKGANLLLPGIIGCDSGIEVNDIVWVIDTNGEVIATGTARMSGEEMAENEKGFAVKIREVSDPRKPAMNEKIATWDDAVKANSLDLSLIEEEASGFIRRTVEKTNARVVVGFSGGKDSLVVYLLVEKSLSKSPPLFFMNTGLELPETVEYVKQFAKKRGVEIIGQDAAERFWEAVDTFGPPARDFRWCCKVLKLGPAAKSISDFLDGETLSFLGQRGLESFQRSIEPRITSNPWVPGQTSANPIQKWNGLEVWLYIFKEEEDFNLLYSRGYHRMGCYLCPASPLAESESLRETHPELHHRWTEKLHEWADKYGFPKEWVEMGFWRWKNLPSGQMNLIKDLGLDIKPDRPGISESLKLNVVKGVSPCVDSGFSLEGQFTDGIDLNRISKVMPIFGQTYISEELGALRNKDAGNSIVLFSSGSMVVRGKDELLIEKTSQQVERAVRRSLFCQACGSCVPQCEYDALNLESGKIAIDEEKCVGCLECDKWPCPTYLT